MKQTIRIGTRESRLAVVQAQWAIDRIQMAYPNLVLEMVTMKSTGDMILDRTLDTIGGKGLFTKELELALLDGRIDLAIHSLKDMPTRLDPRLPIVAFTEREDPRDVLVYPVGLECRGKGPVGCSSARRRVQLKALSPSAEVAPIRGNVPTRLEKLDEGQYGCLVLAAAGLRRLGLARRINRVLTIDEMVPAAGQGILAVQGRAGEEYPYLDVVTDASASDEAVAERAFVNALDGGCGAPIGAYAQCQGQDLHLYGSYADEEAGILRRGKILGDRLDAARLGEALAERLIKEARR